MTLYPFFDGHAQILACARPLEQALLDINDILIAHIVIQADAFLFHLAAGVATMTNDASARTLAGNATPGSQRLHNGHGSFQANLAGLLHLTIDVKQGGPIDE